MKLASIFQRYADEFHRRFGTLLSHEQEKRSTPLFIVVPRVWSTSVRLRALRSYREGTALMR